MGWQGLAFWCCYVMFTHFSLPLGYVHLSHGEDDANLPNLLSEPRIADLCWVTWRRISFQGLRYLSCEMKRITDMTQRPVLRSPKLVMTKWNWGRGEKKEHSVLLLSQAVVCAWNCKASYITRQYGKSPVAHICMEKIGHIILPALQDYSVSY